LKGAWRRVLAWRPVEEKAMMRRLRTACWIGAVITTLVVAPGLRAQERGETSGSTQMAATDRYLYVLRGDRLFAYDAASQRLVGTTSVPGLASPVVADARSENRGSSTARSAPKKSSSPDLAAKGLERSADSGNPTGERARKKAKSSSGGRSPVPAAGSKTTASSNGVGADAGSATPASPGGPAGFGSAPQLVANGRTVFVLNGSQLHNFEAGTLRPLGSRSLSFDDRDRDQVGDAGSRLK
jgi:hypothetical protein